MHTGLPFSGVAGPRGVGLRKGGVKGTARCCFDFLFVALASLAWGSGMPHGRASVRPDLLRPIMVRGIEGTHIPRSGSERDDVLW